MYNQQQQQLQQGGMQQQQPYGQPGQPMTMQQYSEAGIMPVGGAQGQPVPMGQPVGQPGAINPQTGLPYQQQQPMAQPGQPQPMGQPMGQPGQNVPKPIMMQQADGRMAQVQPIMVNMPDGTQQAMVQQ